MLDIEQLYNEGTLLFSPIRRVGTNTTVQVSSPFIEEDMVILVDSKAFKANGNEECLKELAKKLKQQSQV